MRRRKYEKLARLAGTWCSESASGAYIHRAPASCAAMRIQRSVSSGLAAITDFPESGTEATDSAKHISAHGHILGPYVADRGLLGGHPTERGTHYPIELFRKPLGPSGLPTRHDTTARPNDQRIGQWRQQARQPAFSHTDIVVKENDEWCVSIFRAGVPCYRSTRGSPN